MITFRGVTVGIPSGNCAPGRQDGGNLWVVWATGELRIDQASYNLCFVPGGTLSFTPKNIGCLLGAYIAPGEQGGPSSVIVKTTDNVHSSVRLGFEREVDEDAFMQLAHTVEAKRANLDPRRSSVGSPQADWANGLDPCFEQLSEVIRTRCGGALPLIYGGAELYGADPHGNTGSEVLLGRGAVVLLDPPDTAPASCTYDLLFYDETQLQATLRVPIGPKLKLSPQAEADTQRRLSVPRASIGGRMSMGGPSVAACFDFTYEDVKVSALTFDRDLEARSFVRDLSVRLCLARAGLRANREIHNVGNLRGQLHMMRRYSLLARAWRWTLGIAAFAIGLMCLQASVLYFNDDRALNDVVVEVLGNAAVAVELFSGSARNIGTAVCQVFEGGRTFPASAVDACARIPFAEEAQTCIRELSARGNL